MVVNSITNLQQNTCRHCGNLLYSSNLSYNKNSNDRGLCEKCVLSSGITLLNNGKLLHLKPIEIDGN